MYGIQQAKVSDGLAMWVVRRPAGEGCGRRVKVEAGQKPSASL